MALLELFFEDHGDFKISEGKLEAKKAQGQTDKC